MAQNCTELTALSCSTGVSAFNIPAEILATECIGNSLITINNNYSLLYENDLQICNYINETRQFANNIVEPPIGSVIMWNGSVVNYQGVNIPSNSVSRDVECYPSFCASTRRHQTKWLVCTGFNGTPNLINRFIIGAGNSGSATFSPGNVGGAHSISLKPNNIPKLNVSGTSVTVQGTTTPVNDITQYTIQAPAPSISTQAVTISESNQGTSLQDYITVENDLGATTTINETNLKLQFSVGTVTEGTSRRELGPYPFIGKVATDDRFINAINNNGTRGSTWNDLQGYIESGEIIKSNAPGTGGDKNPVNVAGTTYFDVPLNHVHAASTTITGGVRINANNLPSHTHTISPFNVSLDYQPPTLVPTTIQQSPITVQSTGSIAGQYTTNTASGALGDAFDNRPLFAALYYIQRVA